MVAVTDLKGLTVMAKTELIVDKVRANIPCKKLTKLDNLHIIKKQVSPCLLKWVCILRIDKQIC